MNRLLLAVGILFLNSPLTAQEQTQEQFLASFIAGKYHLVGKSLDSDNTYYGKVKLVSTGSGVVVHRIIAEKTTIGSGAIEKATADNVNLLRIRFVENNTEFEETCIIGSDLDNYARITCYLYQSGVKTSNPGLEVLFIDRGENR